MAPHDAALWFIMAVAAVGVVAVLLVRPAGGACSSVTTGGYTAYNCDGNLSTEQHSGPYTSYSPTFPSGERKQPAWRQNLNNSKNVSRETNRVKRQPYSWQRHSRQ